MTAESIAGSYTNDILWRRWLGWWLDSIICLGATAGIIYALRNHPEKIHITLLLMGVFCYFWVPEGIKGVTLGKWVARLRVVDAQGNAPGLLKALLRTLARLLEAVPLTPLPLLGES